MIRRGFLAAATSVSAAAAVPAAIAGSSRAAAANAAARAVPVTGTPVPELAVFDRVMIGALEDFDVRGGQCAVAKDGRLVYARGFGNVDAVASGENPPPVSPTARFRIASCTKPITAVTILKLVELGHLELEERAFEILYDLKPVPGMQLDPRLSSITVRQLLDHSAGFAYPDANGFDPQFDGLRLAAAELGSAVPATHTDVIRYGIHRSAVIHRSA